MDPIRKGYADTPSGQVHFRRVEGNGVPIVLLHRTPASSECFSAMLRLFAGKRAAIALDTPGFGSSFRPRGMPATTDYARWFLEALDALEIGEFHLCAHHTGTHFSADMAIYAPERVRSLLLSGVLYADSELRSTILNDIGPARQIDAQGAYLADAWKIVAKLFPDFDAELVHVETMGALGSIEGRDQAFGAICAQDFADVLARVTCPVAIAQATDDPLDGFLYRVRGRYPDMPIHKIGLAHLAAPERQPKAYADAALSFAATSEQAPKEKIMTDRRFVLSRTATSYDLKETRAAIPEPGTGEVLIRVRAVSVNRRDISIRDLSYPVGDADRFTPMSDAAGEIVAVGPGVRAFSPGDRVCSTFFQNWKSGRVTLPAIVSALGAGGPGVLADHIVLAETGIARIPDSWSFEEGASISCAGVTAWTALKTLDGLQPGDWVLIIGTGGVATFALQIAVAAGARVAILSSSDDKLERARTMGAELTVNYATTPDWDVVVKKETGGVQHAIELGGVGTLSKSIASMGIGGHIAMIGALDGFGGDISGLSLIMSALRVSAVVVGSHSDHIALSDFMVEHGIRPVIDSVFDIDDVETAYAHAAAGAFGKTVVTFN